MDSILQNNRECFICGSQGALDKHHIFFGVKNRSLADKDGLWVYLCPHTCHNFGKDSVHQNREVDVQLKKIAQEKAMAVYDWSVDDFRNRYGKSYI